jgi:hypothetical protein
MVQLGRRWCYWAGRCRKILELAAAAAGAIGIDGEPLLDVIRHRAQRDWRCSPAEFEDYLQAVARTTGFVDQLQLGDQ